ncbi:MAG: helicase-exonuclease AddAB subunit AddA [Clostridia bacterium]|nr:helicase-exonuclease AddAB subunit AddA [Clostridia bacterium]
MPEWTQEQQKAIDSRNGTVLVSAAAGSGKTAVLVERVIRRLMDKEKPCTADRLLIVTFTRAATQQMRERISQAINEELRKNPSDEHLKRQLVMLPFAKISTIDSFCNDIVKENFHELDISPDYKMLEGAQLKLVEAEAMSRTLDGFYKENSEEFNELVNILASGTDDSAVGALVSKLYNYSMAFPRPSEFLDSLTDNYESENTLTKDVWGGIIFSYACGVVAKCLCAIGQVKHSFADDGTVAEKYSDCFSEMEATLNGIMELIDNKKWNETLCALRMIKFPALGRLPKGYASPVADFAKKQKKTITDELTRKLPKYFCSTEEEYADDMAYLHPIVIKLIEIIRRYSEILWEEKQKLNSVDFSDITHLALRLLVSYDAQGNPVRTKLSEELSQKFDEILVDEFQDINELQNTLFWAVSKNESNMFMVGDVKQSIYRFRQAMPDIFLRRRDSMQPYTDNNYPAKITLDRNFRSRPGVTEIVNFVFNQLMSADAGGLDYDKGEALVAAASYDECEFPQAELHIVGSLEDGSRVSREIEAQHIAETINSIIKSGMMITEKGGQRPASYRDFCVLMRATGGGRAELYSDVLARNNIPAYVSNKAGFFASTEISTVLNLMRVTDNPLQDIPLLAVMLSPVFGFTADELAKMRVDERKKPIYHCVLNSARLGNKKSIAFLGKLDELRMLASTLACSEFVRELYEITGYKAITSALKNGSQRNANLNMLLDYAAKYEDSGKRGLSGFIRFIDRVQRQDADLESASDISEAADVVRIMTIHKSKGLEFPVCILADLNNGFTNDNQKGVSAFHPDFGICFDRRDSRTKCQYSTVGKKALLLAEKYSALSEELRVLYVAMTRAKERLICVTRYDNIGSKLEDFSLCVDGDDIRINSVDILNKGSMADWLVMSFLRHPDAHALRQLSGRDGQLSDLACPQRLSVSIVNSVLSPDAAQEEKMKAPADDALLDEIKNRTDYVYPYSSLAFVRAKSAPSEFDSTGFSTQYFASSKPQFLSKSGMNPASRGTATHKFMEFFDYTAEGFSVDEQIEKMIAERHLTRQEADVLEKNKLRRFFESDIADRIKASPLLLREKQVTVGIPACELYPDLDVPCDETVVIQGYVDCAFVEDGELVIVDYKTDRGVTMQELAQRYRTQLKMYEYALAECTGMAVRGTLIYSFENAEYIELKK